MSTVPLVEMNFHLTVSPRKLNPPPTTTCLCLERCSRLASGSVRPKPGMPSPATLIFCAASRASLSPQSSLWFCTSKLQRQVNQHRAACISQENADARRPDMSQPPPVTLAPLSFTTQTPLTDSYLATCQDCRAPNTSDRWLVRGEGRKVNPPLSLEHSCSPLYLTDSSSTFSLPNTSSRKPSLTIP